ncbi:hypothetical protein [Allobaculum mucilyticum]|uniref:hypothetical protein n=1 Tax=Allobaculum mucilyticum TaxID=2834459 RepID=UPI001E342B41|nr:hypothetical protein [Allobaculum mucilyticum]UNT97143.1 hypothetical protein KWG62_05180 [Allobaculum mucilyticum]
MSDIVPKLKKKIDKTFDELVEADEFLSGLIEKIKTQGTWDDAQSCASKIGQHRSRAFLQNISSDILPNGQMYYNIANRIIPPALQSDYDLISEVCMEVQEQVNEEARIGIRAQQADLNTDRIDGIVNRISSEPFDDVKWLLDAPIENFMRSVVDDHVEKNADFHYKSGLNPVIKRTTDGKCCKWCSQHAGTFPYKPDMDREVFRRHENCGCLVAYYPDAKSKQYQDAHSKKWKNEGSQEQQGVSSASPSSGGGGGDGDGGNKKGKPKKKPKTGSKYHRDDWKYDQDLDELIERICPDAIIEETDKKIIYKSKDGEYYIIFDKQQMYHRIMRRDPSTGKYRYVPPNREFMETDKGEDFHRSTHIRTIKKGKGGHNSVNE